MTSLVVRLRIAERQVSLLFVNEHVPRRRVTCVDHVLPPHGSAQYRSWPMARRSRRWDPLPAPPTPRWLRGPAPRPVLRPRHIDAGRGSGTTPAAPAWLP